MKKIFPLLLFILMTSCGEKSFFSDLKCNTARKQAYQGTDDAIIEFREKIAEIEKDEEKKTKSTSKLNDLYSRLGLKYLDKEMWDPAVEAFTNAVKYGRRNPGTFYSLGIAFANRGKDTGSADDLDKAEKNYRKTLELENNHYEAEFALAVLLFFERNRKDEALLIMEKVVRNHKYFYMARFGLARFYYEMSQPGKSLYIYEELAADLGKLPDSEDIIAYRKQCRDNIDRLMREMPADKKK